jgi:uncharacterized protein (DUF2141 family)
MVGSKSIQGLFAGFLLSGISILAGAPTVSEDSGILHIHITGIVDLEGLIYVALWNESEGWLKDEPLLGHEIKANREAVDFFIRDVEPGIYAISVIHDLNSNREFDANFIGIPIEPFGFSNNVRNRFGPVSFKAASFEIAQSPVEQRIEVRPLTQQREEPEGE